MNQETSPLVEKQEVSSPSLFRRWYSILGPALVVLLADQWSKQWALTNLQFGEPWAPIPALRGIFTFTLVTNTGAAFGLFKDGGVFFTILALAVVGGILFYERRIPLRPLWLRGSLGI
ncbi:MAG: signal peptidase II, partial [Chloroflexi bacterium]|nr:signal peptidase II [Chloroflexota bacterium]